MSISPFLRDPKSINFPADITIKADDSFMDAHWITLMCISPYFQKLYKYMRTQSKEQKPIRLHIKRSTLEVILEYAYQGKVSLNCNIIGDLIIAADMYNIYGLLEESSSFLLERLEPINCIGIYLFATAYNCQQLDKASKSYILSNFTQVYELSEEFTRLSTPGLLQEFYQSDFLYVKDELTVWKSLLKWIDYNHQRYIHFPSLAKSLRFGLIGESSLRSILNHPHVQRNEEIIDLIQEVMRTRKMLEWDKTLSISQLCCQHLTPRYPKDIVIVFGGKSSDVEFVTPETLVEAYDHRAERWRKVNIEDPSGPRDHHQACVVGQDIFILGGHEGPFNVFNSCRKFNIVTKVWSEIAPMKEKRAFHTSAIFGRYIYAIGGYNGARRVDTVERYDIDHNQWTSVASMNDRRSGAGAATINNRIYVVGGFCDSYLNTGEFYDPSNNSWTRISCMSRPRSSPSVVNFANQIYVIGGLTNNDLLSSGEKYDLSTNSWSPLESNMIEKKCSAASVVIDDKILIIGGWNGVRGLRTVEIWCNSTKRWLLGTKLIRRRTGCGACVLHNVPNIEEYAWIFRESIVHERLMNVSQSNKEHNKGLDVVNLRSTSDDLQDLMGFE